MFITCKISGVTYTLPHFCHNPNISVGAIHPIFNLPKITLHSLYASYTKGDLCTVESYLLFLALLKHTRSIEFTCPAQYHMDEINTAALIAGNITQLVSVIERSAKILHPAFKQPSFKLAPYNADLSTVPNWIAAWQENITHWHTYNATQKEIESLQVVENALSSLISLGSTPQQYAVTLAEWADKAAEFPAHKEELWKRTIRSCYNKEKMFNTPLAVLKEIMDYIYENIQSDATHFHTLISTVRTGIENHIDYLGGCSMITDYILLPSISSPMYQADIANMEAVANIAANAPKNAPLREDYPDFAAYLRANLAYRSAKISLDRAVKLEDSKNLLDKL